MFGARVIRPYEAEWCGERHRLGPQSSLFYGWEDNFMERIWQGWCMYQKASRCDEILSVEVRERGLL